MNVKQIIKNVIIKLGLRKQAIPTREEQWRT